MLPYCPTTRNPFIGDVPSQEEHTNPPGIGSQQHNLRSSNHYKSFGNGPDTYYPQYCSADSNFRYPKHNEIIGTRSPSYQPPTISNESNPPQPHLYFPDGPNATYPPPHIVYMPEFFNKFDPHGLRPEDYANFPLFELSRQELRSQLNSIGREISLQTVGSTTAASKYLAYLGNPEFLILYLVILGQFLTQGGQVYYVKLPPATPENPTPTLPAMPSFSSTLPIRQDASKRGRDKSEGFGGRESSRRKLNPVDTTDYVLDFTPLTSVDTTPNNDSSAEFSRQPVPSKKHVVVEFGDAVSVSLNLDKPLGARREPVTTAGYPFPVMYDESLQNLIAHEKSPKPAFSSTASNISSPFSLSVEATTPDRSPYASISARPLAPEPLLLPESTCFIRCDPDQGIRIRILPKTTENSEITWIDLPGIWIHTTKQKLPQGVLVMGFSGWIYSEQWISALYQEVLVHESLRGCEQDHVKSRHEWEPADTVSGCKDEYMEYTSDTAGNPKPVRRIIQYPSGDDLGVNWSASEAENTKAKLANKREFSVKWKREVRESTWPWYLWRQFGLSRGWIKEPEEFGDRMRNKDDAEELRRVVTVGILPVGFEDMNEALNGETITQFGSSWTLRHKYSGGPKWDRL
ncbi:80c181a5-84e4-4668-b926-04c5ffb1358d [Sclerotinia trifoliorum]|uniref:80c181a5-84e4-4668-b926-04c5ffb1358d n=1 Tax=Sclerotinia trifoliorum TaxID=28548 RepID=A0A8H2ZY41_9HELO|nr:80c181a5-84e4-4668-b926-04c5ffb1358d [Sclerotinia trifoliorum]